MKCPEKNLKIHILREEGGKEGETLSASRLHWILSGSHYPISIYADPVKVIRCFERDPKLSFVANGTKLKIINYCLLFLSIQKKKKMRKGTFFFILSFNHSMRRRKVLEKSRERSGGDRKMEREKRYC